MKIKILSNPTANLIFRLIVGSLFIYVSIDKIINPAEFAESIRNYELLPNGMTNALGLILPWIELYCGILLLIGFKTKSGAAILGIALMIFIVAILSAIARGLEIDCGCYKSVFLAGKVGFRKIVEDVVLLCMVYFIYIGQNHIFSLDRKLAE